MTDSCRKFNLESNRVLTVEKWFDFDYFSEKKQNNILKFFKNMRNKNDTISVKLQSVWAFHIGAHIMYLGPGKKRKILRHVLFSTFWATVPFDWGHDSNF
jgi:hypothetical protein